jgi:hypothetical protein
LKGVRNVWEMRDGERWKLQTTDLAELRAALGEDVLEDFLRCFVVSDKMTSLVALFNATLEKTEAGSIASRRNNLTFFYLCVDILKEMQLCLEGLRASLNKAGLWDRESWGLDETNSLIRNQAASHVDRDTVKHGLDAMEGGAERVVFAEGKGPKVQDAITSLAHDAVIAGLGLSERQVKDAIEGVKHFDAHDHLVNEFLRVLDARGLKPLYTRIRGERSP